MTFAMRLKHLVSLNYKRLAARFLSIFGLLWLFIEPAGLFFPEWLDWGWQGYAALVCLSLMLAIISSLPKSSFSKPLSSPDTIVAIKIGDLFDQRGHLVIGANDVFDTELGDVIKPTSIQGQFLTRVYQGDQQRLDQEIEAVLQNLKVPKSKEENKPKGKVWRYPIGTTIVLSGGDKRYFLTAYGYMGNDLRVRATADGIWQSLARLWEQIRLKGHGVEVAMPIIGSALARTNLPRMTLIKLIIISFIAASKEGFVSEKLTIVIHPKDLELVDLYALDDFLSSTVY